MSLTKVSYSMITGAAVNVLDFGAVGNGVADDTDAIKAAIAKAVALTQSGNSGIFGSGVTTGTAPTVFFPSGVYKISSALTPDTVQALNYIWFAGEASIITLSAGVICFGGVGFDVRFEGLTFRGGDCGISIKTNNVDTTRIDIINCEFNNQTTACIKSDNNSGSTLLNIYNCKFTRYFSAVGTTGHVAYFGSIDWINFYDCWFYNGSYCCIYNASTLNLFNCVGVPVDAMNTVALGRWVDNYSSVTIDNFRFGGEGSGATFVHNYADMDTTYPIIPSAVIIRNCLAAYTADYVIKFIKLPNRVIFTNNDGLVDSDGFYFAPTLTQTEFLNFQTIGTFEQGNKQFLGTLGTNAQQRTGYEIFIAKAAQRDVSLIPYKDRFVPADIYGSGAFGGGWALDNATNVTAAFVNNAYDVSTWEFVSTTSGTSIFTVSLASYLNPTVLANNITYTLSIQIDASVLSKETVIDIAIAGVVRPLVLTQGNNVFNIPFVYLNTTGVSNAAFDTLLLSCSSMIAGDTIALGRCILIKGLVTYTKEVLELHDTGTPAAYTNGIGYDVGYYRGDISYNSAAASAGFIGSVCTAAPATWKTFGLIS